MSAETWATLAGAGVALVAAVVASVQAGRAIKHARRSADAANRSAAADERAAAAAERANEIATAYKPDWAVDRRGSSAFVLTNKTGETALDAHVDPGPSAVLHGWTPGDIEDGEPRPLDLRGARAMDQITVSWRRPNGEAHTWRGVLPR